ncbi:hypothetical protein [Hyphomicrobium sp.]|uniref:hypothetical protein n=1 Tax=Hyphomicrobium sp. TaxID=82 RepID=UPI002D78975C|nr:hypothetical protein [Hyphomicrobium sp.]HET6387879.1 hypothetical protein [Hyphomicrobium sp.]
MHYELVSRALAYASCISTTSLLLTSVAIAAINVGRVHPSSCHPNACLAGIRVGSEAQLGALTSKAHVASLAAKFWPVI